MMDAHGTKQAMCVRSRLLKNSAHCLYYEAWRQHDLAIHGMDYHTRRGSANRNVKTYKVGLLCREQIHGLVLGF
jgi:hypothetical protein